MSNPYNLKITFNSDAKALLREVKELRVEMEKLKKASKTSTSQADKGAKQAKGSIGALAVKVLRLRAGLVVIGLVAKQAFDIIVGGSIRSQQEMLKAHAAAQRLVAEIQTLTVNSSSSYQIGLTRELRDLSVEFGQTFQTMAKAKYDVVSAGFTGIAESTELLRVSAKGAVAGVTDVATFSKFLASSLRAYGEESNMAADYADIMFTTVQKGVTTIPELAGALGRVTPLANAAGVSFAELGALMATLTAKGLKTQEAATAARALFSQLVGGSEETRERLNDLGITIRGGIVPALKAISEAGGDDAEFLRGILGNMRAYTAAASAGADGAKLFGENMDYMAKRAGNADKAYAIVAETIAVQSDRVAAALANIDQAGGEAYGREFLKRSEGMIDGLKELEESAKTASIVVAPAMARFNEHWTLLKAKTKIFGTYLSTNFMEILSWLVEGLDNVVGAMMKLNEWYVNLIGNIHRFITGGGVAATEDQAAALDDLANSAKLADEATARLWAEGKSATGFRVFVSKMARLKEAFDEGAIPVNRYKALFDKFTASFLENANDFEKAAFMTLAGLEGFEGLELDKVVETLMLQAKNANVRKAAEILGVELATLTTDGFGYAMEDVGPTALGEGLVMMISKLQTTVANANENGAGISLDMARILGTDFSDEAALRDLRVYLDSLRAEAAKYGKSTGKTWQDRFMSQLSGVARELSVEFGESFTIGDEATVQSAINELRQNLIDQGLGDVMAELESLYGIKMENIVDEEGGRAALDLFKETMQQARRIARDALDGMRGDVDVVVGVLDELRRKVGEDVIPTIDELELALDLSGSAEETVEIIRQIVSLMYELGRETDEITNAETWEELIQALKGARDNIQASSDAAEDLGDSITSGITNTLSQAGSRWVELMASGKGGAVMLGNMIRQVLVSAIMDYIAKLIVANTLQKALFAIGLKGGGEVPRHNRGGLVAPIRAAAGMIVPNMVGSQAGADSVHALLMPGEGVIKRHTMQRLENVIGLLEQGSRFGVPHFQSADGATTIVNNFNIARPQGRSDSNEMALTVDDMNRELERRRY